MQHVNDVDNVLILLIGIALLTLWRSMQSFKAIPYVVSISTIELLVNPCLSTFTTLPPSASNVFRGSLNIMFLPALAGREQY